MNNNSQKSILVVDDNPYILKILSMMLELANFKVVNHYRLKAVASVTLAKRINEMKSQNYLVCDASLVLQYIFALVAHLDFPLLQQNTL